MKTSALNKIFAWILLIVFTMGVTPRLFLHDALTSHQDHIFSHSDVKGQHLSQYQFNCGFVTVDQTTFFDRGEAEIYFIKPAGGERKISSNLTHASTLNVLYYSLRAPPIV